MHSADLVRTQDTMLLGVRIVAQCITRLVYMVF